MIYLWPSARTRTAISVWLAWFFWNFIAGLAPIAVVVFFDAPGSPIPQTLKRTLLTGYFSFIVTLMITSLYQLKREHPLKEFAVSISLGFTILFWTIYILYNLSPLVFTWTDVHYWPVCAWSYLLAVVFSIYFQSESIDDRIERKATEVKIEEARRTAEEVARMKKKLEQGDS